MVTGSVQCFIPIPAKNCQALGKIFLSDLASTALQFIKLDPNIWPTRDFRDKMLFLPHANPFCRSLIQSA